jgi:F-type H+-transporting ATPase subunit b
MRRRIRPAALFFAAALVAVGVLLYAGRTPAQGQHAQPGPPATAQRVPVRRGAPNARPIHPPLKKVAAHGHEADAHAEHAAHDESGPPPPINWWHGLLGPKEGAAPSLLWRSPEEPPPFLASVINFAVLAFVIAYFGRKPLASALAKRKESIMREIDEAQKTREAAEARLKQYEAKLERMGEEIERLRSELREQGERQKARIVAEANERRERMRQDAQLLLAHERDEMRRNLTREAVDDAARIAVELLAQRMTLADHERFVETCFAELRAGRGQSAAYGGGPAARGAS